MHCTKLCRRPTETHGNFTRNNREFTEVDYRMHSEMSLTRIQNASCCHHGYSIMIGIKCQIKVISLCTITWESAWSRSWRKVIAIAIETTKSRRKATRMFMVTENKVRNEKGFSMEIWKVSVLPYRISKRPRVYYRVKHDEISSFCLKNRFS